MIRHYFLKEMRFLATANLPLNISLHPKGKNGGLWKK